MFNLQLGALPMQTSFSSLRFSVILAVGLTGGSLGFASSFSPPVVGQTVRPTQMLGSAVADNRIYMIGGNTPVEGWTNGVFSAEIRGQGQIGPWRAELPLPQRRSYLTNSIVALGRRIYVIGGSVAEAPNSEESTMFQSQTVLWSEIGPDGLLQPWRESAPFLGVPRSNLAATGQGSLLIMTGGALRREPIPDVAVSLLGPDGAPGPWRVAAQMPKPLWFHGANLDQGRLWIWGGLTATDNQSATDEVWSAAVDLNTGDIGAWRAEPPLPLRVYSAANIGAGGRLASVTGRLPGNIVSPNILVGDLTADGLKSWRLLSTDIRSHLYHGIGFDPVQGVVFVVGGRQRTNPQHPTEGVVVSEIRAFLLGRPNSSATASVSRPMEAEGGSGFRPRSGGVTRQPLPPESSPLGLSSPDLPPMILLRGAQRPQRGQRSVVIIHSPKSADSRRFEQEVLTNPAAHQLLAPFAVYQIDASRDSSLATELGVFKVPGVVVMDEAGVMIQRSTSLMGLEDLRRVLGNPGR
jgi:hypothetical protein